MKRSNAVALFLALMLIYGAAPLCRLLVAQDADTMFMVVSKNNASGTLTIAAAKKLLTGETSTWHDGQKVLIILKPAGSPDRAVILKKVCGMTEVTYTRYELQASFTGQTAATVTVAPSDAAVKATVKTNPGSVGFLRKNEIDDSVKILLTIE